MTGTYSLGLVALSYVIAVLASYVALDLAGRVTAAEGRAAYYWLVGGAAAMGTGIWSMHFIGMLAYHLPIPMAFDVSVTIVSMLIGIAASGFALFIASRRTLTWQKLALAGTVMGIGIAAMHYTGMEALQIEPGISFERPLFTASVGIAILASCAALWLAFQLRSETVSYAIGKKLGSAMIMAAAIAGMHYTGMAATIFAPNTICTAPSAQIISVWLAVLIAGCSVLFLAATMGISIVEASLSHRLALANAQISELAQTDTLTTLANRRAFLSRLTQMFATTKRGGNPFALLYIDLDKFKEVNDTLGHPVGDALLVEVAHRFKKAVRETDLVARFGGDEFAILQANTTDSTAPGALAAKIGGLLAAPYLLETHEVHITLSIGISQYAAELEKPEEMMMRADLALYRAKNEGRDCFRFFDQDLDREAHERVKLGEELRGAQERGEIELHYQPEVEIATGRIIAVEALVRWNHPTRGLLMPSAFIPVAERTGSIVPLGHWVLNEACRQLRLWLDQGIAPQILAVNISAAQFRRAAGFERDIAEIIATWHIAPGNIELEFSEATLIELAGKHNETLHRLRGFGLGIAVDDFGLGHSSLDYLTRYPPSRLKVAQKLVFEITAHPRNAAVVRAAIGVGRTLGIEVVAEGVENEAQVGFLVAAGCAYAQGYYYSRPVPTEAATNLLRQKVIPSRVVA
jgi:diguanylate cyclase (GGDEF)-like protein